MGLNPGPVLGEVVGVLTVHEGGEEFADEGFVGRHPGARARLQRIAQRHQLIHLRRNPLLLREGREREWSVEELLVVDCGIGDAGLAPLDILYKEWRTKHSIYILPINASEGVNDSERRACDWRWVKFGIDYSDVEQVWTHRRINNGSALDDLAGSRRRILSFDDTRFYDDPSPLINRTDINLGKLGFWLRLPPVVA